MARKRPRDPRARPPTSTGDDPIPSGESAGDATEKPARPTVAENWGAPQRRVALLIVAIVYLSALFLGAVGSSAPHRVLPQSVNYFAQIAKLFPRAAVAVIDYRAEGWLCAERRFAEIDYRPHFPIHAQDKENRFPRALFFHRTDRPVMRALDAYLTERHNTRQSGGAAGADQPPGPGLIGGVRFSSARLPIPPPGSAVTRHAWSPLTALVGEPLRVCPKKFQPSDAPCVAHFYWTRTSERRERCAALAAARRGEPTEAVRPASPTDDEGDLDE